MGHITITGANMQVVRQKAAIVKEKVKVISK
jgi:hypothetical protein